MVVNAPDISVSLVELADTLVSDYDLLEYLDRLLEHSVEVLKADAGGVMLAPDGNGTLALALLAWTDEETRLVELLELQRQEGPCVDSHRTGAAVVEHDLAASDRWPNFAGEAVARGFRSVYAFPMRLRESVIGALNLYREQPGPVAPDGIRAAQALADMATIGILQHRALQDARDLAAQLQRALESRVVIEQAKGILAERLGYDMERAYQAMRWYARNSNRRVRGVATAIVSGTLPATAVTDTEPASS